MLLVMAGMGAVVVWLWLCPPEALSDRARGVLIAAALVIGAASGWDAARTVRFYEQRRREAQQALRRDREMKQEWMRRMREEQRDLGAPPSFEMPRDPAVPPPAAPQRF